jgi:hypothetical protein
VTPVGAQQLIGAWRLVSFEVETADGRIRFPYGHDATGSLVMTVEGRFIAILAAKGRRAAATDQDAQALLRSMIAYTGRYRIDANRVITDVDTMWDESWQGAERTQIRFFTLDGDTLSLITPPMLSAKGTQYTATITWTRET